MVVVDQDVLSQLTSLGNQHACRLFVQVPLAALHIEGAAIASGKRTGGQQLMPAIVSGGKRSLQHGHTRWQARVKRQGLQESQPLRL